MIYSPNMLLVCLDESNTAWNRINNAYDKDTWERMMAIKSRILRIWDTATPGVRACCIKFAQRVVIAQTAGPEGDPRVRSNSRWNGTSANTSQRGEPSEVSLSIVPPNHTILAPRNLEAEASGLLDRMLAVFHENSGCVRLYYIHLPQLMYLAMPSLLMPL